MIMQGEELCVALAGGGSGGHLYPLVSVANELRAHVPTARFLFLTTRRDIDDRILRTEFEHWTDKPVVVSLPVRPLPRRLRDWPTFVSSWFASVRQCRRMMKEDRPHVVLGSGGFGSGPPIKAARRLGIPCALLNPDAVPGRANRYLSKMVDVVFTQWAVSRRHFAEQVTVEVTGCPVRPNFRGAVRAAGIERFGLDPHRRTMLVTGASQGARSINRAMAAVVDTLAAVDGWQVLHLTGAADVAMAEQAYRRRDVRSVVLAYTDHMPEALAAADLVVSRGGASFLAEITAAGVPSVLMPYPHHRDRHQHANAAVLVEEGAAVLVDDRVEATLNGPALSIVLACLMHDRPALAEMAARAQALGRPDAAAAVAQRLLTLAGFVSASRSTSAPSNVSSRDWSKTAPRDDDDSVPLVHPSERSYDAGHTDRRTTEHARRGASGDVRRFA